MVFNEYSFNFLLRPIYISLYSLKFTNLSEFLMHSFPAFGAYCGAVSFQAHAFTVLTS